MIAVARSGHTGLQTWSAFLAPQQSVDNSEGLIGLVWQTKQVQIMPDLPAIDHTSTAEQIADYATQSLMPVNVIKRRVRSKRPCSRALCGIPVEVNGEIWGVLVLDSRRPNTIDYTNTTWASLTTLVPFALGELLKGV
jgi:hypothetical protein